MDFMPKIKFVTPFGEILAKIRSDLNPRTAQMILDFLPMKYQVIIRVWGQEIFFFLPDILKEIGYENTQVELEIGDIAFWPRDPAICIFFGKTPLSQKSNPVASEPVNVFAQILQGLELLPQMTIGDLIWMDKIED